MGSAITYFLRLPLERAGAILSSDVFLHFGRKGNYMSRLNQAESQMCLLDPGLDATKERGLEFTCNQKRWPRFTCDQERWLEFSPFPGKVCQSTLRQKANETHIDNDELHLRDHNVNIIIIIKVKERI